MEISIIPQWLIKCLSSDSRKQYEANVLISNVLIISTFIIFKNNLLGIANKLPHFCLFDKITGVQCPVCGITRAFCELSEGNLVEAINFNFTSLLIALFFILQIPLRVCSLSISKTQKNVTKTSNIFNWIILFAILINWLIILIIRYY